MADQLSDADAIAASQDEPENFGTLFDRHSDAVHSYVQRRVGRMRADDLTAETFLVAFRRRDSYDPARPNARPWLLGIATNLLRQFWRQERRELHAYARSGEDPLAPQPEDAERHLERTAIDPGVARALASLSSDDLEVLLLYAWADLSYEAIAEALGIPVGTVRSRLSRARRQARELLSAEEAIEEEKHVRNWSTP